MNRTDRMQTAHEIAVDVLDDDLAIAVTECDAFGAFATKLAQAGDDEPGHMREALEGVADGLDEDQLEWLINAANAPAAYLASRL